MFTYISRLGVVGSDVSRSSCTTSFRPRCSIFSPSYVFFQGSVVHFLMLSMYCILERPLLPSPGIIPRMHVFTSLQFIVSACMSKEIHFSFDNLSKEFASGLKFIQYAQDCLSFSPSNLSAAFFGSTTFQL